MARKRNRIHYWYLVIFLCAITALAWFFLEVTATVQVDQSSKIAQSLLTPLKPTFNDRALKKIMNRQTISEVDLQRAAAYTEYNQSFGPVDEPEIIADPDSAAPEMATPSPTLEIGVVEPFEASSSSDISP